ncbi:MAG: tyrosine-type recombinase/integrase [Magnetococcales bacterium]|nr:tyrosine-type recombinase/integrase [Magnetococcales bacterium]
MPKLAPGQLTALKVAKIRKVGLHADGGNLYLQVSGLQAKSWIFRFRMTGRDRTMGLGSVQDVPLVEARARATEARRQVQSGIDPIDTRQQARQQEEAKRTTFKDCAVAFIQAHKDGWSNPKHIAQWTSTLTTYAFPAIGETPIAEVGTDQVLAILEPIWTAKAETASRVRGRIEAVLDWATVRQYRQGENPARWKGHLDHLLPARSKVTRVEHHAALPYRELPGFMLTLQEQDGVGALALQFTILTATRTSETLNAMWREIDMDTRTWTIPAERMKADKEHRVPLSDSAISILQRMRERRESEFVFPGNRRGNPLSNMTMLMTLRRMGRGDLTAHGFRSTFRDWAAEQTSYPREVCEMALAHAVVGVEGAYRRGDMFEKRRSLMETWGAFAQ